MGKLLLPSRCKSYGTEQAGPQTAAEYHSCSETVVAVPMISPVELNAAWRSSGDKGCALAGSSTLTDCPPRRPSRAWTARSGIANRNLAKPLAATDYYSSSGSKTAAVFSPVVSSVVNTNRHMGKLLQPPPSRCKSYGTEQAGPQTAAEDHSCFETVVAVPMISPVLAVDSIANRNFAKPFQPWTPSRSESRGTEQPGLQAAANCYSESPIAATLLTPQQQLRFQLQQIHQNAQRLMQNLLALSNAPN